MKTLVLTTLITAASIWLSNGVRADADAGTAATSTITTAELAALIQAKAPVVILDARSGKYDDGRRLPGAKALAPDATAEQAAAVIGVKHSRVITYCSSPKCPASAKLAAQLKTLGYTNVTKYPDGIDGWVAAGQAVEAPRAPK